MRNLSIFILLAAFFLSPMPAFSAHKGGQAQADNVGGFVGPISGVQAETVAAARELENDAPVLLTGNILSSVAGTKDKFIFRDQTGEIMIEIDKKAFRGQTVTPQDTVQLSGKVDKEFGKDTEIDVKRIGILAR